MSITCGESPESLPVGPRSHECDNKQTKKMISLLRFACNTDLGPKTLVACSINDNFCTAKLYQKVRIMLAVLFFEKQMKIMLVVTKCAKNYASPIYQSLPENRGDATMHNFLNPLPISHICITLVRVKTGDKICLLFADNNVNYLCS